MTFRRLLSCKAVAIMFVGVLSGCGSSDEQGLDAAKDTPGPMDGQVEWDLPEGEELDATKDTAGPQDTAVGADEVTQLDTTVVWDVDTGPCGHGTIKGRACAPEQHMYLAGATVVVETTDCDGSPFTTQTTSQGQYGDYTVSNVPSGIAHLTITLGAFKAEFDVPVTAGETTDLSFMSQKGCFASNVVQIAVITGDYDRIESLVGALGLEYTLYYGDADNLDGNEDHPQHAKNLIGNLDEMRNYDMIFINCSDYFYMSIWWGEGNPPTKYMDNFRQYVNEGGRIYASDRAFFAIMDTWPEAIAFELNIFDFYNCDNPSGCLMCGYAPFTTEATIQNPNMQALVGAETVQVTYELDGWAIVGGYHASAQSHIIGDVQTASMPLCPSPPVTIHNSPLVVSYKPNPTAGNVVFTTFHNVEQEELIGEEMKLILKYLVFML